jgi:glucosamine 6-phosphate synthetase-like amidotransferase/phosphosugar isomerase protein
MPKEIDEFVAPIPYIIPGQLFAALLADAKGLDAGPAAFTVRR